MKTYNEIKIGGHTITIIQEKLKDPNAASFFDPETLTIKLDSRQSDSDKLISLIGLLIQMSSVSYVNRGELKENLSPKFITATAVHIATVLEGLGLKTDNN